MNDKDKVLIQAWNDEVYSKMDEVDPRDEYYWTSLSYGFFLGKGVSIEKADELANYVYGLDFKT